MSSENLELGSSYESPSLSEAGALGTLSRLSVQKARDASPLRRLHREPGVRAAAGVIAEALAGHDIVAEPPEIIWRASGLRRAGVVAQVVWPRLATRFGLGLETTLAHAVVDHLLGTSRSEAEARLQVSPVEWGILTFLMARGLARLAEVPGPFGRWDAWLDRVGPDPFDPSGLSRVVTVRWFIRLGEAAGSLRLWLPGPLIEQWVANGPDVWPPPRPPDARQAAWSSTWHAQAGTVALPRGLKTLRRGAVLPLFRSPLRGTPGAPDGEIELVNSTGGGGVYRWPARPLPDSGGGRLRLAAAPPWRREPPYREPLPMNPTKPAPLDSAPPDLPVTLVVELGRVDIPLSRLADLQPGDVVELQRHPREPVELTSGGRPVARGELVQIENELGVRVTHVYL